MQNFILGQVTELLCEPLLSLCKGGFCSLPVVCSVPAYLQFLFIRLWVFMPTIFCLSYWSREVVGACQCQRLSLE